MRQKNRRCIGDRINTIQHDLAICREIVFCLWCKSSYLIPDHRFESLMCRWVSYQLLTTKAKIISTSSFFTHRVLFKPIRSTWVYSARFCVKPLARVALSLQTFALLVQDAVLKLTWKSLTSQSFFTPVTSLYYFLYYFLANATQAPRVYMLF